MEVPFLDLKVTDDRTRARLLEAVDVVLRHGRLVLGPEVQALEARIAAHCSRRYAVGVGSGTDALFLSLKAMNIGRGDEVITTALSWIATANAIALTGAQPVFCDVRDDLNLDPAEVPKRITARTKAILLVHFTGKMCDMDALTAVSERYHLPLVEDASQAFGAVYGGRKAGSFGLLGCFSMNPMKVFGACGDAGIVVTDQAELHTRLQALRHHGVVNRHTCMDISLSGRLDTLQAAILLRRLDGVAAIVRRRREIAARYHGYLAGVVATPLEASNQSDTYYTYTIRVPRRDELRTYLQSRGIETQIQHPILMPEQPAYRSAAQGEYPVAQRLTREILCIPANEKLTNDQVDYVASAICDFYGVS
jgi:dTDP-4-amino-4,6-dideoxygalactose transaminase